MNVMRLINQHPLLRAELHQLGIANTTLRDVADQLDRQLGGHSNYNLCYVLSTLTGREFARSIDIAHLAQRVPLAPELLQSIVLIIAPWIEQFRMEKFGIEQFAGNQHQLAPVRASTHVNGHSAR